jgi:hypothetical protein
VACQSREKQGTRYAHLCPRHHGHPIQRVNLEEQAEGLERGVEQERVDLELEVEWDAGERR